MDDEKIDIALVAIDVLTDVLTNHLAWSQPTAKVKTIVFLLQLRDCLERAEVVPVADSPGKKWAGSMNGKGAKHAV